jgi:phage terminase small subunit
VKAPQHLAKSTRDWWSSVVRDYSLEEHHTRLLTLAAEAWDRAQEARTTLVTDGTYYVDRFGAPRVHPAVAVERDARLAFARLIRELDLDGEPAPDPRMPRRR